MLQPWFRKHLSVGLAPMETVLASGKGKSCYLDVGGEQRLWDEFSIHLGCEDADCLYTSALLVMERRTSPEMQG